MRKKRNTLESSTKEDSSFQRARTGGVPSPWGDHEHPSLASPQYATPGNGLLLFFRVDDFELALPRARALVARFEEEPNLNPSTGTMEFSLRDPDGYYVTVSAS